MPQIPINKMTTFLGLPLLRLLSDYDDSVELFLVSTACSLHLLSLLVLSLFLLLVLGKYIIVFTKIAIFRENPTFVLARKRAKHLFLIFSLFHLQQQLVDIRVDMSPKSRFSTHIRATPFNSANFLPARLTCFSTAFVSSS